MTDTIDLLRSRRSVPAHTMTGPGPTPAELDTILAAASRVPDHGKLVPFRFLVFDGDARLEAGEVIEAIYRRDDAAADEAKLKLERERLARAPMVIAVVARVRPHAKIPQWEQELVVGATCMNLVVAANALGFVTSWLTEWIAYDRRVLDAFGLAPDERLAGFIHIGRSEGRPPDRERPDLAAIVTHYGS